MKLLAFFVVLIFGISATVYSLLFGKIHHTLDYDNEKHIGRFLFCFFAFLLVSLGLAFLPVTIWPLPVMVLCVTLFSNQITGLLSAGVFTAVSTMAAGKSMYEFALYFSVCAVTVLVFYGIDESVRLGLPIFIDISAIAVIEAALLFLANGKHIRTDTLILAVVNLIFCTLLEIIVLKLFCSTVIFKNRDRYLIINDTEYLVMKEAKEKNKNVYMRAVHTAYLTDKLSHALGITSPEVKTASYYFRIADAFENRNENYYTGLCQENQFPKAAKELILECIDQKNGIHSKEACIVLLADAMISQVMELFQEKLSDKPDYEKIVRELLFEKAKNKYFDSCDISIRELKMIENTLIKENLYYDFLR